MEPSRLPFNNPPKDTKRVSKCTEFSKYVLKRQRCQLGERVEVSNAVPQC